LEGKVMDKEGNTMINGKISIGNCVSRLILGIFALWSIRQHHKNPGPVCLDDRTILMVQFKLNWSERHQGVTQEDRLAPSHSHWLPLLGIPERPLALTKEKLWARIRGDALL
jgi:hypothetical protein